MKGPPLRILHLDSLLNGGGTDDQCVKLVHGLRQLGAEASLAGPPDREFSKVAAELGVPLHPTPPEGPLQLRFIRAAARLVRQEKIQLLHGHHGRDIWPTILAARLSGLRPKIVLTRHMAKSPSSWPSRRFLLGQCDALIAVSEFTAQILREGHHDSASSNPERHHRPPILGNRSKIHVVYGGIDTARFQPRPDNDPAVQALRQNWGLQPEHFTFAVIGSFDRPRGKGQREFLQAAASITRAAPGARFLVIGRGNMESVLRADIARLGLEAAAIMAGHCADMPAVMNAIDCLVHPQVGTEALGLVVCEAHACGRAVIASDLDGIPEAFAVGRLGRLIRPESIEEMAAAMIGQARQGRETEANRRQVHALVDAAFSLRVSARNHLDLLESVAAGTFPPRTSAR